MACPLCKSETPPPPCICPHCGAFVSVIPQSQPSRADKLIVIIPVALVLMVVALGVIGFYAIKKSTGKYRAAMRTQRSQIAVVHGKALAPGELQASGKLYFVPMGKQVIPVQSLADYYEKKFAMHIDVLPEVALTAADCLPERKQCIAEEMILASKRAYPKIARDLDSIVIILTDEDLYSRSLRWEFTYAFHSDYRFGVVSTRRMDPAFWKTPPDDKWRLAATHQMLTDYIAFLYFHVPRSSDPTSVMYQPFTPDGGSDDLYQSDIHSEESANGLRGDGYPCLTFTYSYEIDDIAPRRFINDCYENADPRSTEQETFQIELAHGQLVQRSFDFQIDSLPPIDFRRAYLSQYTQPLAFGLGGNHNYNNWLLSDGAARLSFIDIIHEDGNRNHLARSSSGIGFSSSVVFEDRDDTGELFGSRMTWDSGHFKLAERDGSWFTYLPCTDSRCFWIGYSDAQKNSLKFDRDGHLALQGLTASDGQGIQFQSDGQARIVEGKDTKGNRVTYTYDPTGCLAR